MAVHQMGDLLPKYVKTYSTFDFKLKSPRENGQTFVQNSIIKSKYFSIQDLIVKNL